MLLLLAWWLLLVACYASAFAWLHFHSMCVRELSMTPPVKADTQVEPSDLYQGVYSDLRSTMKRAQLSFFFFACASTLFLASHFFTPRTPINLGPLGNTTL